MKKKSPTSLYYDKRHFTLSSHFLSYFKSPSDRFPLGYLSLAEVMSISSGGGTIELGMREAGGDGKERKYKLLAESREEGDVWRQKIEAAVVALRKQEAARKLTSLSSGDDELSPRTPMALKRRSSGGDSGEWKDEPSELERSFFQLKFRGGNVCRLLMEVRSNLDILRFLIELLLDSQDMRQGTLMALSDDYFRTKRQGAHGAFGPNGFTLPPSLALAVAASSSTSSAATSINGTSAAVAHHRIASAIDANSKTVEEHKEKSNKSISNPTSPLASPRSSQVSADLSRLRTTSVISSAAFASKMKQMSDKLASYSLIVASLSFDDKAYLLSWLLSPSTTLSLAALLDIPNSVLHDRVLRVLYLCCIVQVKREKAVKLVGSEDGWIFECVGDRFAALMKKHIVRVTQPSFQLQLFQSLLAMMTTPLSAFAHPLFMTNLSFANTRLHHPQLLRTLFASLFHTEFHLRKKVLKDLSLILTGRGHATALLRERESARWLLLMIADVPLRARRKIGVVRKVTEYVMRAIAQLHIVAFKGSEERIEEEEKVAKSEKVNGKLEADSDSKEGSAFPFFSIPSFPELVARSLLLSTTSSPRHFHGTTRSMLLHLVSHLLHNSSLFYSNSSSPSSTSASPRAGGANGPVRHMDAMCWSNLLHLLLMVKLFVFVPSRYRELIASAELSSKVGSAARVRSPSDVTLGGAPASSRASVVHPALATSSSTMTDLISSSALNSTMKNDNPHDPYLLDLPALVNLQLAPLPHEKTTPSPKTKPKSLAVPTTSPPPATHVAPAAAAASFELDFVAGSSDKYDVHRLERRGLKADADLLSAVARLLQVLSEQQWQPLQSASVKGGVRINERLEVELSFFQDANVFLLLLAPMVSTEAVPSPSSATTTTFQSSSFGATGGSTAAPTTTATTSAPTATTPAFTSSLLTPAETAEIVCAFMSAKSNSRRKVFRHYEMKFRSREQAEHKAAETRSKLIEQQMLADAEKERLVTRILLLGTMEAGKSTLFKQTQRVFGSGCNAHDRQQHVVMVMANLLRAMRALIYHSDRLLVRFPFSALSNTTGSSTTTISPSLSGSKDFISQMDLLQHFPLLQTNNAGKIVPQAVSPTLASALHPSETFSSLLQLCLTHLSNLWSDLGVQLTFENRAKFDHHQLYDSDGYFLSRLSTLQDIRWLPTDEDIVRTRVRSLGVQQYQWEDGSGQRYRMTDVAGQRSERKKWSPSILAHSTSTHARPAAPRVYARSLC